MRFDEALVKALRIQELCPDIAICGSIALILAGLLPEREVHDVDMVAQLPEGKTFEDVIGAGCLPYQIIKGDYGRDYKTWPHEHCLFYIRDLKIVLIQLEIKIQCPDQILYWKNKFNRSKDKADITAITGAILLGDSDGQ